MNQDTSHPSDPNRQDRNGRGAIAPYDQRSRAVDEAVGYGALTESQHPGDDWRRWTSVLWRRKWLVLAITIAGGALGVLVAALVRPSYESEVRLWVQGAGDQNAGPLQGGEFLQAFDWVDLLRSYAVLEPVVRQEALVVVPEERSDLPMFAGFQAGDAIVPGEYELRAAGDGRVLVRDDSVTVERVAAGAPVGAAAGFAWVPPADRFAGSGEPIRFEIRDPREVARELAEDLEVGMLEQGSFMHLRLSSTSPERGARVLNAIADRFVELARSLRSGRAEELEGMLAQQVVQAEERLDNAEAALQRFRTSTATMAASSYPSSQLSPTESSYFDLVYARDRIRRDRRALEQILAAAPDPASLPTFLETVPIAAESTELAGTIDELGRKKLELWSASRTFTPEHPTVQALEEDIRTMEQERIPALARRIAAGLATQEATLDAEVQLRAVEVAALPAVVAEEAQLQRDVAIASELFSLLKTRHETARLAIASETSQIRVLDRAQAPILPMTDLRSRIALFSLFLGFAVGAIGTVLVDRWDPRIRYPEEVSEGLGLNILGTIPQLRLGDAKPGDGVAEEATEAFRGLRLNLAYAYGAAGPVVTAVTSPAPGDGKSFVSLNLALSFSRIGQRTLLIDGDVRRGKVHRTLKIPRRPGLVDYLTGSASKEEIVRQTEYPNLDVIAAGTRQKDAPELLSSSALSEVLADARAKYDVVIIDTSPLGAGIDPLVFAALAGNLLMVVRSGSTIRGFTEAKLATVTRLPIRVMGAVMNAVPATSAYPYYYYYFPEYAPNREERETATAST